jgi:glutamate-1-semialdehyde 2,1-aminomutase
MTTVAIIQARLGSQRLPGKVLMDICGKTMIERVYERVVQAKRVTTAVVATSYAPENRRLIGHCYQRHIIALRGGQDENDALSRYLEVSRMMMADRIVRITGDCPLIDPGLIDDVIALQEETGQPYVNNVDPRTYPDGLDVEVFTRVALEAADLETQGEEREHVTPFLRRQWQEGHLQQAASYLGELKWSVDTEEDLAFVRRVYEELGQDIFPWQMVLNLHA